MIQQNISPKSRWIVMRRVLTWMLIVCVSGLSNAVGQSGSSVARPSFDAATIKKSAPPFGRVSTKVASESLYFGNVSLQMCIERAFGLQRYQVIGPEWLAQEHYVIQARSAGPVSNLQMMSMLRTLLEDRFHLASHLTNKEMPVYALTSDGNHHGMRPSTEPADGQDVGIGPIPGGGWSFVRVSMPELADFLSGRLLNIDLPVVDMSHLTGYFDFKLSFANVPQSFQVEEGDIVGTISSQLGLHVKLTTAPVQVLVVDHADREPASN